MEVTAKKSLYIRGLQAAYSGVLEVIDDAFHVAVYRYFTDRSKWERMDIEGSAYLTRNSSIPLYSLIVLNKKGAADLVLHVEENIERAQVQDQYIMLRCKNDDGRVIFGIWIHEKVDRDRFFSSISRTKDIRKNSPDMTSLLSKFVLRSQSPRTATIIEDSSVSNNNNNSISTSSSAQPTKISFSSILQRPADSSTYIVSTSALAPSSTSVATSPVPGKKVTSALTAFIAGSNSSNGNSSTASLPSPVKTGEKSSALLSLLKTGSKKEVDSSAPSTSETTPEHSSAASSPTSSTSASGVASLEDIIKKPEIAANVGSNIKASAKLLSLLAGNAKTDSAASSSSAALDFPTDVQISAKVKHQQQLQQQQQPSLQRGSPTSANPLAALKAVLSISPQPPIAATATISATASNTYPSNFSLLYSQPEKELDVLAATSPPANSLLTAGNNNHLRAMLLAAVSPPPPPVTPTNRVSVSTSASPATTATTTATATTRSTASPTTITVTTNASNYGNSNNNSTLLLREKLFSVSSSAVSSPSPVPAVAQTVVLPIRAASAPSAASSSSATAIGTASVKKTPKLISPSDFGDLC